MSSINNNNMNSTITQCTQLPYTLILVIPGTPSPNETKEEQSVKHYDELIYAIMKTIDIPYVTHCTNEEYQLITIHRAGDTLIHIIPSNTLRKHLLKQKGKMKSIKTRVISVMQSTPLTNGITYYRTSNLIKE